MLHKYHYFFQCNAARIPVGKNKLIFKTYRQINTNTLNVVSCNKLLDIAFVY